MSKIEQTFCQESEDMGTMRQRPSLMVCQVIILAVKFFTCNYFPDKQIGGKSYVDSI